ncbi:MAG: 1-deoxy-D-xylulose-5-phosphate reductoisomerase [Dictyoglomaceae bacterium]
MKNVVILGASGSIGFQTIDIIRKHKDKFRILGLAVKENVSILKDLAEEFKPPYLAIYNSSVEKPSLSYTPKILFGREGIEILASLKEADLVVIAISGISAIYPTRQAILNNKKIALATKEVIVTAGKFLKEWLKNSKSEIIPVDSEHSAIFQLLQNRKSVERIILTASGGPFFGKDRKYIEEVKLEDVLKHPRWKMGKKTTIDSANLVNKALEIVEAHYLFDFPYEKIDVLIHPQSIVHGIIEFIDGSFIAYLSPPDMKFAIQYALFHPERISYKWEKLNLMDLKLEFYPVDDKVFPIISYLYEMVKRGDVYPPILAVSDEIFVSHFLNGDIKFSQIVPLIIKVMENWKGKSKIESIEELFDLIDWVKRESLRLLGRY